MQMKNPVIVTEGKTDIAYIKSALKIYIRNTQIWLTRIQMGSLSSKFHFFRRSKRTRFFFNMSLDGADAMKIFIAFFWLWR